MIASSQDETEDYRPITTVHYSVVCLSLNVYTKLVSGKRNAEIHTDPTGHDKTVFLCRRRVVGGGVNTV